MSVDERVALAQFLHSSAPGFAKLAPLPDVLKLRSEKLNKPNHSKRSR
jgi:hypothetical protein